MSLYPSLEDMKVGQMIQAQSTLVSSQQQQLPPSCPPYPVSNSAVPQGKYDGLYPTLDDYMGLSLTSDEMAIVQQQTMPVVHCQANDVTMIAPLSGNSLGLQRAKISHGLREIQLCKDKDGRVGLRVQAVNKGVFVVFVYANSPAALVGLRFGDQILQINHENVAGFSRDKVHDIIKKGPSNGIHMVVRDRPFERTITLHKDSVGNIGFSFKNGKINAIVKESSAARNGLLIDHNLLEVNGQNVVGMQDKGIVKILESGGEIITLTIIPSIIYDQMIKNMGASLVKKFMDHSIPDI